MAGKYVFVALTALTATFVSLTPVSADDLETIHVLRNPDRYLVGRGPAIPIVGKRRSIEPQTAESQAAESQVAAPSAPHEKSAAVISGSYTVIPNATPGYNSNYSYLRFPNFNSDLTTTATVRMVGDTTGRDYGTASVESPPNSSPQLTVTELLDSIEGGTFDSTDQTVTLYIQSNQFLTGVQHVYYNTSSGFFENMSICSFVDGISYVPPTSGVVNVHTTNLQSNYPSVVKIHNKDATAATLTLRIHDGPTGALRGKMSFTAQPNSTYAFTSAQLQSAIGFIPTSADYHLNVFFDTDPNTPPNATISHTVTNTTVGTAVLNLTTICTIND